MSFLRVYTRAYIAKNIYFKKTTQLTDLLVIAVRSSMKESIVKINWTSL